MLCFMLILTPIIVFLFILLGIEYSSHVSSSKIWSKKWGDGDMKVFREEFKRRQWTRDRYDDDVLDSRHDDSKVSASTIRFNGIGMVMKDPLEYIKFRIFLRDFMIMSKKAELNAKRFNWRSGR